MSWSPALALTPRLARMLEREEQQALGRGDGYLGTEHVLEALIDDLDGVAGQILERLGVVPAIREELEAFWSNPDPK